MLVIVMWCAAGTVVIVLETCSGSDGLMVMASAVDGDLR